MGVWLGRLRGWTWGQLELPAAPCGQGSHGLGPLPVGREEHCAQGTAMQEEGRWTARVPAPHPGVRGRNADLKDSFGSIALDVVAVGDNLQHAVPHLFTHVVARNADKIEDGVHVPAVVHRVLLG